MYIDCENPTEKEGRAALLTCLLLYMSSLEPCLGMTYLGSSYRFKTWSIGKYVQDFLDVREFCVQCGIYSALFENISVSK